MIHRIVQFNHGKIYFSPNKKIIRSKKRMGKAISHQPFFCSAAFVLFNMAGSKNHTGPSQSSDLWFLPRNHRMCFAGDFSSFFPLARITAGYSLFHFRRGGRQRCANYSKRDTLWEVSRQLLG